MDRQLAVLGSPIEHSKSPAIHLAAYRVLGLGWKYGRFEVREGGLRNFVDSLDEQWLGLSLTMPLKEEAARIAIALDSTARVTNAVNTLVRAKSGWLGFNTDVFGISQAIKQTPLSRIETILVIGSGATAVSAVAAIKLFAPNSKVSVWARNEIAREKLVAFASQLGLAAKATGKLKSAAVNSDLVISTLPAGALDDFAAKLYKSRFFKPHGFLLDVVYKDWPTSLAKVWQKQKRPTISGLEMLIWQAVAQIRIFVNGNPDQTLTNEVAVVEAMRHAVAD